MSMSLRKFAALQTEAHEAYRTVGIFGDQKAVDLALQNQVGAVVAQQRNAIGNPVLAQQVFGADQPVAEHFEETGRANFRGRVQIFGKRANCALIDLEEQTVLAAEVLEDGTLGDAERDGNVADACGVISMLGKMLRGRFDDAGAFRL